MQSPSQLTSQSLARRAFLALLLTIGFYGLAIAIIGVLLAIPYAEIRYTERIHLRLAAFCVIGAGTIAWSILPRRGTFEAPGPKLAASDHPRLFAEIEQIAHDVDQEMPADVYLVPDVNAFVAERGGFLGFGSRRIMGLGLPLLQNLTVSQLRAVLAHEFGHYHGGDTKLSPWIYRTRTTIIRTVQNLADGSWLQKPFIWYGKMFLRITHSISRHQEFVADRLAARTVGATALIEGLKTVHRVSGAFRAYMQNEFLPVIRQGFRPSFTKGFSAFVGAAPISKAMDEALDSEMNESEDTPYGTHPSLHDRMEAVSALPSSHQDGDDAPALSLLDNIPALEDQLLSHLFGADKSRSWTTVAWRDVGEHVYVPSWEASLSDYADAFAGISVASLPDFLQSPDNLVARIRRMADGSISDKDIGQAVLTITGRALAVSLVRQGWDVEVSPGMPVSVSQNGFEVRPFDVLRKLASRSLAAETWHELCKDAGIADLELGMAAAEPATINQPVSSQPAGAQSQTR